MRKYASPIVFILLLAFCVTFIAPITPAYAFSLGDLLSNPSGSSSPFSGNGLLNILIGLLLGKFFNNSSSTGDSSPPSISSVLGLDSGSIGKKIIDTAQKYMGTPYVWGGETPAGFDCSGFTQYVMKLNKITIPRTADTQFASGTPVDKNKLQIGDLVFFTTYKAGASHVGIYMGDNKFIHASSAGDVVKISSLDEQYYKERYIGARRYAN